MTHIYRLEQIKRWQVVQVRQQSRDFSLLAIETTIEKKQEDNKSPEEKLSKIFKSSAGETRRNSRWTFLTGNRVSQVNNVLQNYLERTKSWHFISLCEEIFLRLCFQFLAALIISKVGINIIRYEASWINQSVFN